MIGLESYYLSGLPIPLQYNLGKIFPLNIRYMFENNIDYDEFVRPFLIRIDLFDFKVDGLCDFDLFFSSFNESDELLNLLIDKLKILYRTDNVKAISSIRIIIVNDKIMINRENYTYLADVALEMMYATKIKPKKTQSKYKNKYLQATWEKLQKYRKKEEEKKSLQLSDILNTLIHISNNFDYDKVLNLTYYQVMNSYITLTKKIGYDEFMMYKTSGQFKIEQNVKHWSNETKIKKSIYSKKN